MEKVKITFLGTGNAVPTKLRNHSAILLKYKNEQILVDCGEGTQRQFKIAGLSMQKVTRILITHWHGDHTLGLPGFLETLAMSDFKGKLKIYGPAGTLKNFSYLQGLMRAYDKVNFEVFEVSNGIFIDENEFFIEARSLRHGIPTNGYSFVIKEKRRLDKMKLKKLKLPNSPILGKLQEGKDIIYEGKTIHAKNVSYLEEGKKVSFAFDSAATDEISKLAKDADLAIFESSYSSEEEEIALEHLHLTSTQSAGLAKKAGVIKLILTHLSERYEHRSEDILKEAKKIFKATALAKDFDQVIV